MRYELRFRVEGYRYPVQLDLVGDRIQLRFNYAPKLIVEIKKMEGARWNPDGKFWHIANSQHNLFQIAFLSEKNPYERYDGPLIEFESRRRKPDGTTALMDQQTDMTRHTITRRACIIAGEMGVGKTLAIIEALEWFCHHDVLWAGPKSALYSVKLEFDKWAICEICKLPRKPIQLYDEARTIIPAHKNDHPWLTPKDIKPSFHTYDSLRKLIDTWPEGKKPPRVVVYDECSRLKNPIAQRTQAAQNLADEMRSVWGDESIIIEMSGSPAPKSPLDWYSICEIARPGFLVEGDYKKFQKRLSIIEQRENVVTGGTYPHLLGWRDSVKRCESCGLMDTDVRHDLSRGGHSFQPCVDEVSHLYKRMNGLVLVKFKKDCMNLPDKRYEVIQLTPSGELLRTAQLINERCSSAIQALTLLRELSDGFQYRDIETGIDPCPICSGSKVHKYPYDALHPDDPLDSLSIQHGKKILYDAAGTPTVTDEPIDIQFREQACESCYGTGTIPKLTRSTIEVKSPKEDTLKDLVDLHEDVGRLVVYGGFTGSIDKIVSVIKRMGWETIRVDGRGWQSSLPLKDPVRMLDAFQNDKSIERCVFVGQPGAAGMGLTLTASPSIVYYSNDFNAESRIQSEDRIHRPGMDMNRGATIYDILLLPSDALVLNNLQRKRRLQDLSMGQMRDEIKALKWSEVRNF